MPSVDQGFTAAQPMTPSGQQNADLSMAVLGDSLATGAATHPAMAFDAKVLWDIFDGRLGIAPKLEDLPPGGPWIRPEPLDEPQRLWPSVREFFGGPDWVFRNMMQTIARTYLDTEEYSWGYMVARGLGLPAKNLMIAAENGARMEAMPRQIDRVLDATAGGMPDRILMMFTGNDLCGPNIDQITSAADYESALKNGFAYLLRNGKPSARGTDVYLLSHLGILQLLYEESIVAKPVRAFGAELTCGALRQQGYVPKDPTAYDSGLPVDAWWFGMVMPPNPAAYCPTLFGFQSRSETREELTNTLANRIRSYRESESRAIQGASEQAQKSGTSVRFHHVTATADLRFVGEDIGQDCFHLSPKGQGKVAGAVLKEMGVH
jgi:hypothetical protein